HHKDAGPCWNILVEAKPGSRMDRFTGISDGNATVTRMKEVVAALFPWDEPFVRNMQLADPLGWLIGAVTPAVRQPSARLANGSVVAALGDTAISFDPIAAQGANSGIKQARHLVERIVARGSGAFDSDWITNTFDDYFATHARPACEFSNLLLEPITSPAKELLIAQYGSDGRVDDHSPQQRIADAFVENFNDPRLLTPAFTDMTVSRQVIASHAEGRWLWNGVRGRASIAGDQLKAKLRRTA
ncbi:MAG: hypothetical protein QOE82_1939, partial [Thermoanaerobaculia bacterium]|nr:hypothetical protein [Thermoanaerobaculia bacterium]